MKEIFRLRFQYGNRLMSNEVHASRKVDNFVMNFMRMITNDFEYLESLIGPKIERMNTNMREPITVKERLVISLRFLATGDSYTSLQYLFRISKNSISLIVKGACGTINEALQDYVKVSRPKQLEQV